MTSSDLITRSRGRHPEPSFPYKWHSNCKAKVGLVPFSYQTLIAFSVGAVRFISLCRCAGDISDTVNASTGQLPTRSPGDVWVSNFVLNDGETGSKIGELRGFCVALDNG